MFDQDICTMMLSVVYCFLFVNTLIPWICATGSYQVNFKEIRTVTSALLQNNTGPDTLYVKLNNCGIKNIDKDSLKHTTKLKKFDVSRNELECLVDGTFEYSLELTFLSLTHNYIMNLDKNVFQNLTKLSKLYLKQNKISHIDRELFSDLVNLRELSLSYNMLQNIDSGCFLKTTNLQTILLAHNKLSSLDDGLFSSLKRLEVLYLGSNLITDIGQYAFPSNSVLKIVNLDDNKLQYLHNETIDSLRTVTQLLLYENAWICDCRLINLYNIWKNHTSYFAPKCAGPDNMQNISWDKLKPNDLLYCVNMKTDTTTNNTTKHMDNENNEDKKINCNCDNFFVENIPFTCETSQDKFQGHYTSVQTKIYDNNTIYTCNHIKINTNTDDEEIYKCQFTGPPTVEKKFLLKINLNKSEMDNDNIWKIVCLALITILVLIIFIIIIPIIVKIYKRNTPLLYDIPVVPLETVCK